MVSEKIAPQGTCELVVWYALIYTYPIYLLGGLYILAPVLGWLLFALALYYWVRYPNINGHNKTPSNKPITIPTNVTIWLIAMLVMEVALIIGHASFDLGIPKLIKSSIGWAKGWALLAIFIFVGAVLPIRNAIIYRACNIIGLQTLLITPFLILFYFIGLPGTLYISPLSIIGGPGPEFFEVQIYGINPESGLPRWRYFAPWAPAAGLLANIYFIFAMQDASRIWRILGITAALMICVLCQSRAGFVVILVTAPIVYLLRKLSNPYILLLLAVGLLFTSILADTLLSILNNAYDDFKSARSGSSRVRDGLARIAIQRWSDEAPIWGHGIVERGPHLVEYMPIGSHHTWYGLLFVKGAVGFAALALAMSSTYICLLRKVVSQPQAGVGIAMLIILSLYTLGENLEILSYLFWPALIIIGRCSRPI
ncbi:MAG: capsular biosynthesis protein [Gammaproteobacteria bacterium]|nr:MAG: capsular biosynthesis protein [Gammaproteobacteria bacterium]